MYVSGVKHSAAASVALLFLASLAAGDDKKTLTFSLTVMGEIEDTAATKAGFHTSHFNTTHLGFHTYEASDGEKVFSHSGHFTDKFEAQRYYDWNLDHRAAEVVRRGDKPDRDGSAVGRRAEYLAKSDGKEKADVDGRRELLFD